MHYENIYGQRFYYHRMYYDDYIFGVYIKDYDQAIEVIRLLNVNSLITCALHGTSFSESANQFVKLLLRNWNFVVTMHDVR